ncbi:TP53-binding protein 1 isoform X2 [Syngnathoides biaculeatus]|uniref:TP53-binding protein 1 isoform X2 n=1 Tax=Syngnathoides biaculeatus TaxID=300417 RepID=UPI002ADE4D92|nr:TP53-binding protein 1 isoform X2 [Syngnathoides biaculeatus]
MVQPWLYRFPRSRVDWEVRTCASCLLIGPGVYRTMGTSTPVSLIVCKCEPTSPCSPTNLSVSWSRPDFMDPGGSELGSSLPQLDNPCLIVEDSQPDSVALEDDPDSSYRAVLVRRLSNLQPSACSPVLELLSSPLGTGASQTDIPPQSCRNNSQAGILALPSHSSECEEESRVLNIKPLPSKQKSSIPMDSDSTTPCDQSEERNMNTMTSQDSLSKEVRSEVSSKSHLGQMPNIQVLLHSQCLQDSGELERQDHEIISQQDMFDVEKTDAGIDTTVSEPEQQGHPSTPAQTLRLLHLSGQETFAQQSLSQSSVDYVATTPGNFPYTPDLTTGADSQRGAVEPMDICQPPEEQAGLKGQVPMETEASLKLQPPTSTHVSQISPGFVIEQPLSLPSQPELSNDVFIPTQSQDASNQSDKTEYMSRGSPRQELAPAFTLPLQLSVNMDLSNFAQKLSEEIIEDTQATQIEKLEEQPLVDTTDSVFQCPDQSRCNSTSTKSQSATSSKTCNEPMLLFNVPNTNAKGFEIDIKDQSPPNVLACSQSKVESSDMIVNPCMPDSPSNITTHSVDSQSITHISLMQVAKSGMNAVASVGSPSQSPSQNSGTINSLMSKVEIDKLADENASASEEKDVAMEDDNTVGDKASSTALVQSQSKLTSSGDEGGVVDESIVRVAESNRDSQNSPKIPSQLLKGNDPHSSTGKVSFTVGHEPLEQEPEEYRAKSFSGSSGEMSFHFTLPKDGELIGPVVGATPPLINQLKGTLRHSTPIETFSEKSDVAMSVNADVVMEAKGNAPEECGDNLSEKGDNRLSLRMRFVTPIEEESSERFSLQKPGLSEEDESVATVTTVAKEETSLSVFSCVRQVHRQQEAEDVDCHVPGGNHMPIRGELFTSPQRSSQTPPFGCSLPTRQSETLQLEVLEVSQEGAQNTQAEQSEERTVRVPNQKDTSVHTLDNTAAASTSDKGEPETPSYRRKTGPSHCRHVRTIQEVRTTITRIITDVYYEDGKEVHRKVTEESEDPVVDCQVLDSDSSPCRTISSSLTSGDLGDISSLSSKASSLQQSSGGTSTTTAGLSRPEFIIPPSRTASSVSPKKGGGQKQRGHWGQKAGRVVTKNRINSTLESRALASHTPRGQAKRGRPSTRGVGASSLPRLLTQGQALSSSEDEPYTHRVLPRVAVSPTDAEIPCHSSSHHLSPEETSSAGTSFVGLRIVAKWSSNGYFYSGRIVKDPGEGRFRLRFDDGYECEVAAKDILLCDPIPLETEVTALLEDEFFSVGIVKGYKTEGQDLFYSVEREGQKQWYNRMSVILSLEQGNRLRERHSLGPYEPSTPLSKASDISLDNLVEGKRRRRGPPGGSNTPVHSSSSSPRNPGPSTKRRLRTLDNENSPTKRSRRGPLARADQRVGVCNTSGSGTDVAAQPCDPAETHGPIPENSSLFMGFAFMLTASSERDRLNNKLTSVDDEDDDYVQTGPFNKAYTQSQLQAGGGFVLLDFNEEQCKAAYQSLLIVDQHCRTRKYLLCLASGVPCVSHLWVRDCCNDNKLLNYRNYLLPAGLGPDDVIVEWHPRCCPFKDLHFLLVFEKPVELWAQLVTMGGASSVRHYYAEKDSSDVPAGKYDVVVSDHSCPPLLEKNVMTLEVPLVSPEWLIQSVICGERLGFQKKPQYHHNYYSMMMSS